ncbi:PadR family transcriptional regulator [Blastococcus xanthinilyticus]|uniref:PadR family transcriptional regulator n=1 Tax=Blastococcus xanthinilyticus TaxID=1564164 RepID=A0A5S5CMB0_9ACTN|nr:PadR family transcriptional regulator [Blastococcus xanthinilyticus]TYP80652.1 PadR family transcriptional regulator [Blastococcus xanthinilyticus]
MPNDTWPSEWLRAVLPLCVLAAVADEETYGYAVAQRLQAGGLGTVKGGTLYPVLNRLEEEGLVTSSWREGAGGPGRKYFAVTTAGAEHLAARAAAWQSFTERAAGLLPSVRSSR